MTGRTDEYSPKMIRAVFATLGAYNRLIETGRWRRWVGYGNHAHCRLCNVSYNAACVDDCRFCPLEHRRGGPGCGHETLLRLKDIIQDLAIGDTVYTLDDLRAAAIARRAELLWRFRAAGIAGLPDV